MPRLLNNFLKIVTLDPLPRNLGLFTQLVVRDFKTRFAGSTLGIFWALLQPMCMMAILWAVFSFGLKINPAGSEVSFAAWFFTGIVPWYFIQEGIQTSQNSLLEYSFLVKKVNFQVQLLPEVKVFSSLMVHLIFMGLLFAVVIFCGVTPKWTWLLIPYYTFCAIYLITGLGWLTSAVSVFIRDTNQLLSIGLQMGFWLTPIIWRLESLPPKVQALMKFNPIYYITEGYRNSILYDQPFRNQDASQFLLFWAICLGVMALGHLCFKHLRPHFGDVL